MYCATGGNCQLFAYEVLAHFGYAIPDLRSEELWRDAVSTMVVAQPRRYDLVLFHHDEKPYGAHVGVVWGPDGVIHLCKEVGRPIVWSWGEFSSRPRYQHVIGFKRPLAHEPGARRPAVKPEMRS